MAYSEAEHALGQACAAIGSPATRGVGGIRFACGLCGAVNKDRQHHWIGCVEPPFGGSSGHAVTSRPEQCFQIGRRVGAECGSEPFVAMLMVGESARDCGVLGMRGLPMTPPINVACREERPARRR